MDAQTGWANFYDFSQDGVILLGYRGLGAFVIPGRVSFSTAKLGTKPYCRKGPMGACWGMAERLIQERKWRPPTELVERLVKAIDRIAQL